MEVQERNQSNIKIVEPTRQSKIVVRQNPERMRFSYWIVKTTCWLFSRAWLGLEVHHIERLPMRGPVLILPTHTSHLDPPIIGGAMPREAHYLAREQITNVPIFGPFCKHMNAHPIRQGAGDREAIRVCRLVLQAGHPLVFFPEGTRSRTGTLNHIQTGWVMILEGLGEIPYVPVVMQDTHKAMPRGSLYPRRAKVHVTFGHPAYLPVRMEGEKSRDYHTRCRAELERAYRELGAR